MSWYEVTGTLSDLAMASVAVYAAFNAKQWFSQRSHSKGFDNAEDILSKIDLNYRNLVKSIGQLHEALEFLSAIKSGIAQADVALLEKYENLAKEHTNNISAIDAIVEQLDVIERWSIIVLDRDVILKVTKLMREANVSSANAYNSSRGCIYDINYMSMDEFETL